jgi:glycogen debranching enzyme
LTRFLLDTNILSDLVRNVPQGWAAGSIFSLLQAMLGFQPDAPNKLLYVDPHLPTWMPDLTVRDLRL